MFPTSLDAAHVDRYTQLRAGVFLSHSGLGLRKKSRASTAASRRDVDRIKAAPK